MLVVLSDLHFEEEASDIIPGDDVHPPVIFSRNLPALPYRRLVAHLASEAVRNGATQLDLVLAGDIFDIHRTALWFAEDEFAGARPYTDNAEVDTLLEGRIVQILEAIAAEETIAGVLAVLQKLTGGYYEDGGEERPFPVPVHLHYIPGNHDRLVNATPTTRRAARRLLGLPDSPAPFPYALPVERERVLVRHGHEYDPYNFSHDLSGWPDIPVHLPEEYYRRPTFGDFVTVDIASYLPHLFRQHHGDSAILRDEALRAVYLRLLEFDDLRPQSAMLHFLLSISETKLDAGMVWSLLEPVLRRLLENIHRHPFLREWLRRLNRPWHIDVVDFMRILLGVRIWRWGIPFWLARWLSRKALQRHAAMPDTERMAVRERGVRQGDYYFLLAGHTHTPRVNLLHADSLGERYYVDTGTWRNQVPASPDFTDFGRLKALTYIIIYGPDEDKGRPPQPDKRLSFDFWTGFTQRWRREI